MIFPRMFSKRIFSETWALPITVVIAVMAYVALASTFYNMDVWLLYKSTFDKRTLHARMYLDDEAIKTCSLNISSFDQSTLHVRMYIDYQRIKHCQRHNGPEGWVHLAKVTSWGHIRCSNISLDHISSSESRLSVN